MGNLQQTFSPGFWTGSGKGNTMPGSVKLRSIKRFGQENSGYEFSDEGEECVTY